jgi:hypothetical protein
MQLERAANRRQETIRKLGNALVEMFARKDLPVS